MCTATGLVSQSVVSPSPQEKRHALTAADVSTLNRYGIRATPVSSPPPMERTISFCAAVTVQRITLEAPPESVTLTTTAWVPLGSVSAAQVTTPVTLSIKSHAGPELI